MPNTLRRIAPALLLLAPLLFGREALAAQQTLTTAVAPAVAPSETAPDQTPAPVVSEAETASAKEVESAAASAPPAPQAAARNFFETAAVKAAPFEAEKTFGYRAPSFAAGETAQDSKQSGGTQGQGGSSGGQGGHQSGRQTDPDPTGNQRTPLTPGEKMERAFRNAFLSPVPYATSAFSATLTQAGEDELPDKDFEDEFGDWASRFARTFANRTSRSILSNGVYASLFKQDPRYERPRNKSFGGRIAHAVTRVFVTRDDDGNLEPNYSRFAGSLTASALANIYERSTPGHDRKGADATFRRFGLSFAYDALSNVLFREVIPTIFGR